MRFGWHSPLVQPRRVVLALGTVEHRLYGMKAEDIASSHQELAYAAYLWLLVIWVVFYVFLHILHLFSFIFSFGFVFIFLMCFTWLYFRSFSKVNNITCVPFSI
jgi:hypothetical protein